MNNQLNNDKMELKMELKTAIEILEYHQEWRLGKREDMIHEPQKLTEALDVVINEVKKLEVSTNEAENSALNKGAVMPRFSVSLVYQNAKSIMLRTLILNATDEANALLETMDYFKNKKETDGMGLLLKAVTRINEA